MDATMLILEQRFALFILLNVYRNPGMMKCEAVDFNGGSGRAKYDMLDKLINAGLIKEDLRTFKYNARPLYCTELGPKVCELLEVIYNLLPHLECKTSEYTSHAKYW